MIWFGVVLTILGATIMAFYAISQRKLFSRGRSDDDRPAESVVSGSAMIVGAIALFSAFFLSGQAADVQPGFWKFVAMTGTLNIVISYCGFKAMQTKDDVSLVIPIRDTTPSVVVLVSWLITGEVPTTLGYIGIILLVMGTYTLNVQTLVDKLYAGHWSWRAFLEPWLALGRLRGVRYALVASCIGCVAITYDGLAARAGNPLLAIACVMSFSAVAHTARAGLTGFGKQFFELRRGMPWGGIGLGLLYATSAALYYSSFRYLIVAYQATVKRTETLMVLILAYVILGERKDFRTRLVAVGLMVAGTVCIIWH
ncbi:MAG: EamA family transporter [Patescibacteria group bacterium]